VAQSAFTAPAIQSGPTKLFVGSIPNGVTREMMKEEFGKYGAVAEVFLKGDNSEPGRMWGFVTFVNPESSSAAVSALNEQFVFPGAQRPLSVSFARSSSSSSTAAAVTPISYVAPPADACSWKVYYTAQGLPYYHDTLTGITQWECPPGFPGGPAPVKTDPASTASLLQQAQAADAQTSGGLGLGPVAAASDSQRSAPF